VKIKGPGGNLSGALGKDMIFSSWRGKPYAKRYTKPRDPKSERQVDHRAVFHQGAKAWRAMKHSQKAFYDGLAADTTGYSLFLGRYIRAREAGQAVEVPLVLRWRRAGEPGLGTRLAVRKGDRVLFEFNLRKEEGEFALTALDAPYELTLRHADEVWTWELESVPEAGLSKTGELEGLKVDFR